MTEIRMSAIRVLWIGAAILVFSCQGVIAADGTCPAARPEVQVDAVHDEVREHFNTTVADLAQAAKDHNVQLRHPILGGYTSSISIGLSINDRITDLGKGRRCSVPEVIRVRLTLTGRAIHLPREFASIACLHDLALGHQRKHVKADDTLFDDVVSTFAEDIRARLAKLVLDPAPSEAAARLRMTEAARKIVEEQLNTYSDAKAKIGKMIDSPEEVARLSEACGGALKAQGL